MQFVLGEETFGYVTSQDKSNTDFRLLVGGSQNVQIDFQKKVKIRSGYTRLGAANTSLTEVRNSWTWRTSRKYERTSATTSRVLPQRFYDDELEVYLGTIDTVELDAWYRVKDGWSTTEILRSCIQYGGNGGWFDATEKMDLQYMVNGDDKLYEWSGGVAVVTSVTGSTITKAGSRTFAQNKFYTTRNKTLINVRTGTEFTYTGGETTTTLTGVTGDPTADGMVAGDVLVQKVVEYDNTPEDGYNNHFIYNFENQIIIGSEDDGRVFGSQNNSASSYTSSSPRVAGEGFTLTLDNPTRGITSLGSNLLIGSGNSAIFRVQLEQIAVGSTLAETAKIKKLDVGVNQGFLNHDSIVSVSDTIFYLSNEVALRKIEDPNNLVGINPKALSNPIKPDFDAEDWTNAFGIWYKNILLFSAPANSRLYMLNFVEDANGKLFRFWNPPQILPVQSMSIFDVDGVEGLYGHSNSVPETYLLFDGASDGQYADMPVEDKLPINARAVFAYNNYKQRARLKNFDEYYVEGDITAATTELALTLRYDFDGITQEIEKIIDGSNEDILEGELGFNSLAQQSLAQNPLGGLLNEPEGTRRFRVIFEIAREDFFELQAEFSTNDVDKFWSILSHGSNAQISRRIPTNIKL